MSGRRDRFVDAPPLLRRVLHCGWFVRTTKWSQVLCYRRKAIERGCWRGWGDIVGAMWWAGAGPLEYFEFRFFDLDEAARAEYVTTAIAVELHARNSRGGDRTLFRDKLRFNERFAGLTGRRSLDHAALLARPDDERPFDVFAKPRFGQNGIGARKLYGFASWRALKAAVAERLPDPGGYLFEEAIRQHPTMAGLNASSVNTLRVCTAVQDGKARVVRAVLKTGHGAAVDNVVAGGLAAPVDPDSGRVSGPARGFDPFASPCTFHPGSGVRFEGFAVPHWDSVLDVVRRAALTIPEIALVGWDVAIGERGALIVEGNDNWDKTLLQVPHGRGARREYADFEKSRTMFLPRPVPSLF